MQRGFSLLALRLAAALLSAYSHKQKGAQPSRAANAPCYFQCWNLTGDPRVWIFRRGKRTRNGTSPALPSLFCFTSC